MALNDSGNVVADRGNNLPTIAAGGGVPDPAGNIYFADAHRVRELTPASDAGIAFGDLDGIGNAPSRDLTARSRTRLDTLITKATPSDTTGHGKRHLSTVLAHLMMLAFPIDRTRQRRCEVFRRARSRAKRPKYPWESVRGAFPMAAAPDREKKTQYALATKDGVVAVAIDDASQPDRRLPTVRRGGFFGDDRSRTATPDEPARVVCRSATDAPPTLEIGCGMRAPALVGLAGSK